MTARELLKEARDELGAVQYYIPPADETVEMTHAITADVDACQRLAERIDAYLAEPEPDAMEMVRKIREGATFGHDLSERYCKLLDSEAAALIADYGRRVPRAFVEEILDKAWNCLTDRPEGMVLQTIADKYAVQVEDAK